MRTGCLVAALAALGACGEQAQPPPAVKLASLPQRRLPAAQLDRMRPRRACRLHRSTPRRVRALVDGRAFELRQPSDRGRHAALCWEGLLQPAGLADIIDAREGGWAGDPPAAADVELIADYGDGRRARRRLRELPLRAGYG